MMNSSSQAFCLFLIYVFFFYSFKMLKFGQRVNVGPCVCIFSGTARKMIIKPSPMVIV